MNSHRKLILDKFYQCISDNSETLPIEVNDVAAEIWNLEEECEFWKVLAYKYRSFKHSPDMSVKSGECLSYNSSCNS
jgi:hypothetical protein